MTEYDPKSWWKPILQLQGSVLPNLLPRIVLAFGVGLGASALFASTGFKVPPFLHTLVGAALGLLLVFRTNASYDRFWEGRKLLGHFVNRARDLARQTAAYVDGDDDETRRDRAEIGRLIGLLYALVRQGLRKERDLGALGGRITGEERAALEAVTNRYNVAAAWISARLADLARRGRLSEQRLQAMDANLTAFLDDYGGCERIVKTPVPFAYAQHIKAFLVLFVYTAPFAMVDAMGWFTPLASAILAYALFGIDEIGVEIEEPFGYDPNDLPLDRIGETIEGDVAAILGTVGGGREATVRVAAGG